MRGDVDTIERSLIGALLVAPAVAVPWAVGEAELTPDDFFAPSRRRLFDAIVQLEQLGAVDRPLLVDRLAGDRDALAELDACSVVAGAGNFKQYARRVREMATTRRVVAKAQEVLQHAQQGVEGKALADVAVALMDDAAIGGRERGAAVSAAEAIGAAIDTFDRGTTPGLSTGFVGLDELTGAMHPGQLWIVAARPAMGKSAFSVNVAEAFATAGLPTALYALEMSAGEVAQRLMASGATIPLDRIRKGTQFASDAKRLMRLGQEWTGRPLFIDDSAVLTLPELRAKVRALHRRHGLRLVVVDYLQLIQGSERAGNRTQAVDEISRGLKVLARELGVTVLAVAQLSRALEQRGATIDSKRPMLSDLRESGAIEQDADVVAFLFRREYYEQLLNGEVTDENRGLADLIVAKVRNGTPGDVKLIYAGEYVRFQDRGEVVA